MLPQDCNWKGMQSQVLADNRVRMCVRAKTHQASIQRSP